MTGIGCANTCDGIDRWEGGEEEARGCGLDHGH